MVKMDEKIRKFKCDRENCEVTAELPLKKIHIIKKLPEGWSEVHKDIYCRACTQTYESMYRDFKEGKDLVK